MSRQHHENVLREMSDQEVIDRYCKETLKLKMLTQFGRHSERFSGYPDTGMMNRCKRELERRGLPIPPVNPPGGEMRDFLSLIEQEYLKATRKHPPLHSLHEAYAVLLEEVDELKEQVWKQSSQRHPQIMVTELAQIAAMAMRAVLDCLWKDESS